MDNNIQPDQPNAGPKSGRGNAFRLTAFVLFAVVVVYYWRAHTSSVPSVPDSPTKWKSFVAVEGQPDKVPAEWVSTPEGQFAHSIKLPDPLPADSGYKEGMTGKEYWEHLCQTQAGEFVYKTVDNVEGFYFMRPPNRPTDDDMKDRYKLEAPDLERIFQLFPQSAESRGASFVNPPWAAFQYVEEPSDYVERAEHYLRVFGYNSREKLPMKTEKVSTLKSKYGLVWRGVKRAHDREFAIGGSEWIVIDLKTLEVLAVQRNYAFTGWIKNLPEGIWWLTAVACPNTSSKYVDSNRYYDFVSKVLRPVATNEK